MTVQIDTTAEIDAVRLKTESSHPPAPSAGHVLLYFVTGTAVPGLYTELADGQKIGPFITGSSSATNSVLGTANFDASGGSVGGLYNSGVISGIVRNSTGNFTVSLSPAQMNVVVVVTANETGGGGGGVSCWITSASGNFQSPTSSFVFRTLSGSLGANIDPSYVAIAIIKL